MLRRFCLTVQSKNRRYDSPFTTFTTLMLAESNTIQAALTNNSLVCHRFKPNRNHLIVKNVWRKATHYYTERSQLATLNLFKNAFVLIQLAIRITGLSPKMNGTQFEFEWFFEMLKNLPARLTISGARNNTSVTLACIPMAPHRLHYLLQNYAMLSKDAKNIYNLTKLHFACSIGQEWTIVLALTTRLYPTFEGSNYRLL